jgi:hypothetical protein
MFVAIVKSEGRLIPSEQFQKVYRKAAHIKAAMNYLSDWRLEAETPDLLTYMPHVPQQSGRRKKYELYKLVPTDVRLYFVNVRVLLERRLEQLLKG